MKSSSPPPPPVISCSNTPLLDFRSAFAFKLILITWRTAMKLRALLVICLLIPFAAAAANADDHIDNMCFLPESEGGWAGKCWSETHWVAGWYVYRHGATWTLNNRAWLAGEILSSSETTREVAVPPRGTEPRITGILPTQKSSSDTITTFYPHGTTVTTVKNADEDYAIITFRDSSTVLVFDYLTKTKTEINGVAGDATESQF